MDMFEKWLKQQIEKLQDDLRHCQTEQEKRDVMTEILTFKKVMRQYGLPPEKYFEEEDDTIEIAFIENFPGVK